MTDPAPSVPPDLPRLPLMDPQELSGMPARPDAGAGCLSTGAGNLPLRALEVRAHLSGLTSRVRLTQRFVNPHREPLEATYVFPLPDRGAVTAVRMTAAGRTVVARLREREEARAQYDAAVAAGRRASIAEEERPDVFSLRVGNVLPGEEVTVDLTVIGVLPVADGEATFRFPLVVAPRYVPGHPLPGDSVGPGHQPDTDAVPDASRISPPVLLPGFPHPVRLDVSITVDPAGLPMGTPRTSLPAVVEPTGVVRLHPGQRADRDVVLRIPLGESGRPSAALTLVPDTDTGARPDTRTGTIEAGSGTDPAGEGTFELVVLPPDLAATPHPRDVALVLDRSGSMAGWKMVAARRSAARIVDTLTDHDRFAVLAFDTVAETPGEGPAVLVPGTDRHRFAAVEFLARVGARGGTELSEPLGAALALLAGSRGAGRDAVLVLVTDGQVGNEDQILRQHASALSAVRVHAVGIDQAVNAGFLGRLASWGGGRCELVESEDRLDEAMVRIHRRIGSPVVTGPALEPAGVTLVPDSFASRLPDVFPGVPWVLRGRYRDAGDAAVTVRGTGADGEPWAVTASGRAGGGPALPAVWARGQVRDLEDRYVVACGGSGVPGDRPAAAELERLIVATSLRFGVLSRFTAYVAEDDRVVTDGTAPRQVVQPVELPAGWAAPQPPAAGPALTLRSAPAALDRAVHLASRGASGGAERAGPADEWFVAPRVIRGFARPSVRRRLSREQPGNASDHAVTWELLRRELDRLRAAAGEPLPLRRAALSDLASRLRAVPAPPPGALPQAWERLTEVLGLRPGASPAAGSGDPGGAAEPATAFERRWREVIDALEALLGEQGSRRATFWRHGPET